MQSDISVQKIKEFKKVQSIRDKPPCWQPDAPNNMKLSEEKLNDLFEMQLKGSLHGFVCIHIHYHVTCQVHSACHVNIIVIISCFLAFFRMGRMTENKLGWGTRTKGIIKVH